jgi:hypothetical protein
MLAPATIERFERALASDNLKQLAERMTAEGLSQPAVYQLFESFLEFLEQQKRESDEEVLHDCLDCIVGYCSPGSKWFSHYLTNEEIDAYRKRIG